MQSCNQKGNCEEECRSYSEGDNQMADFDLTEDNSDQIRRDDDGSLVLDQSEANFTFLWAANSEEGTVSKIDTRTGHEMARYVTALPNVANDIPSPLQHCSFPEGNNPGEGNCPSRTAVDMQGNVWVANRAFGHQGSVTKILNRCQDKNHNGEIDTSSDVNGNNIIDLNNPDEFLGVNDECIEFTIPIGSPGAVPRALAIDPFAPRRNVGSVWVGAWVEQKFYRVDNQSGEILEIVDVPIHPYGAVMDRHRRLWSTDGGGGSDGLIAIYSSTDPVLAPSDVSPVYPFRNTIGCQGSYGVAVDSNDRVWVGGYPCEAAYRFDPDSESWLTVQLPRGTGVGRGIAVSRDGWVYQGHSWTTDNYLVAKVSRFRIEDGSQIQVWDLPGNQGTIGVGLDFQENVWAINEASSNATRINTETGAMDSFPTGQGPYTYSDFTGYQLRTFTAAMGSYTTMTEACQTQGVAGQWQTLSWEADTPPGTAVQVQVRTAEHVNQLAGAEYYGPWNRSPVDLHAAGVPDGNVIEIYVQLSTEEDGLTPRLWSVDVSWTCPFL